MIQIEKVGNGFVATTFEEDEEGNFVENKTVYEQIRDSFDKDKDRESELKAVQNLFYDMMDELGIFNSKHEKYNLLIEIKDNTDE